MSIIHNCTCVQCVRLVRVSGLIDISSHFKLIFSFFRLACCCPQSFNCACGWGKVEHSQTCLTKKHYICVCPKSGACNFVVDVDCYLSYLLSISHAIGFFFWRIFKFCHVGPVIHVSVYTVRVKFIAECHRNTVTYSFLHLGNLCHLDCWIYT